MEPLPLPPQLDTPPTFERTPARPGQLTLAWRTVFIVGWAGVVLGLGAVVKSSRTMGLSTWWLGPDAAPRPIVVQLLPFTLPAIAIILGFRNARFLPYAGTIAALLLGAVAVGDLDRFDALAQVELVTAGIGLLVSVASFAGVLRRSPAVADPVTLAAPHASAATPPTVTPPTITPPPPPPSAPLGDPTGTPSA